jgi:hypothetical protein
MKCATPRSVGICHRLCALILARETSPAAPPLNEYSTELLSLPECPLKRAAAASEPKLLRRHIFTDVIRSVRKPVRQQNTRSRQSSASCLSTLIANLTKRECHDYLRVNGDVTAPGDVLKMRPQSSSCQERLGVPGIPGRHPRYQDGPRDRWSV